MNLEVGIILSVLLVLSGVSVALAHLAWVIQTILGEEEDGE